MILSFSVFKDKIESGEKCQTIRRYNETRYHSLLNAKKYQLYWHNPRNGGKLIKEVIPSIAPFIIMFDHNPTAPILQVNDIGLTPLYPSSQREIAKDDGFVSPEELYRWFQEKYGGALFSEKFMVIRWHPMEMRGEVK